MSLQHLVHKNTCPAVLKIIQLHVTKLSSLESREPIINFANLFSSPMCGRLYLGKWSSWCYCQEISSFLPKQWLPNHPTAWKAGILAGVVAAVLDHEVWIWTIRRQSIQPEGTWGLYRAKLLYQPRITCFGGRHMWEKLLFLKPCNLASLLLAEDPDPNHHGEWGRMGEWVVQETGIKLWRWFLVIWKSFDFNGLPIIFSWLA